MSATRFVFLLTVFMLVDGCTNPKPAIDPLAGWHFETHDPNQVIENDYKAYISSLSPEEFPYHR